jgi:hypothetical protein
VNLLLDEQLDNNDGSVSTALNAFTVRRALAFRSLRTDKRGMQDDEVVRYCKDEGFDAVVSFNHRDFGKKKALYRDLMAAGVSVVVLRPPKQPAFTPERQASLITLHLRCIERHLTEMQLLGPVLIRLSPTECRQRTLGEIEAEFTADARTLP